MEILTKIFEVVTNKISLPVAILVAILLFNPLNIIYKFELEDFVSSNKSILWIIFLFAIILYLYEKSIKLLKLIHEKISKKYLASKSLKIITKNLDGLSDLEKAWIYYCLRENIRTIIATSINSIAVSLEGKGIISRPYGQYNILNTPFTIGNNVWKYLKKNKDIYCSDKKLNDITYNSYVDKIVKNARSVVGE